MSRKCLHLLLCYSQEEPQASVPSACEAAGPWVFSWKLFLLEDQGSGFEWTYTA